MFNFSTRLFQLGYLSQRYVKDMNKLVVQQVRLNSTRQKSKSSDENEDQPIQFSTSQAGGWTARQSRTGKKVDNVPWFQPFSIVFSLSAVLIYFCVLREENDIDIDLGRSLYDRIPGLEKKQLELSLQYNVEHNMDTSAIKNRLQELEQQGEDNVIPIQN